MAGRKSHAELHPKKKKKKTDITIDEKKRKKRIPANTVQECPSCLTLTMRAGGCNHICCTCGTRWCWQCHQVKGLGLNLCADPNHRSH